MRARVLVVALALGCGRIDFGSLGARDGGASDAIDAAVSTGPLGPRWLAQLGTTAFLIASGRGGEVAASVEFQGSVTANATMFTGRSPYMSTLAARFDRTGALASAAVLDSAGFCNMRGVTVLPNGDTLDVGLALDGASMWGPCDTPGSGHEDAIAVAVDRLGNQTLVGLWLAGSVNAQAWYADATSDGLAVTGIYGDALTLGTTALPPAQNNEQAFFARFAPGATSPTWSTASLGALPNAPAPPVIAGADTCLAGSYMGTTTIFGTAYANAGADDVWVARVDATGAPRFVRVVQSSADDLPTALLASNDGGCVVAVQAGDLVVDGTSLPASGGAGAVLHFGPSGAFVAGARLPVAMPLVRVASGVYGAFTATAPITIGGTTYTPAGAADVVIVAVDDTGARAIVGAVGGAGSQQLVQLAAIAPDAIVVAVSNIGALAFGALVDDSGSADVGELAVLGL